MRLFFTFSAVVLFISCSDQYSLDPLPIEPLLHNGNSKLWVIDQILKGKKNLAPQVNMQKDVLVFYENGKCIVQPMSSIGDIVGKKGEYKAYSEDSTLTLYFKNEKWDFKLKFFGEDTIVLAPKKSSDLAYKLVIVPFPEF
jgi:hypothetical protein